MTYYNRKIDESLLGPERDPQECHYCDLCSRPIREAVFGKERVWVAENGTIFCKTSDGKNSLVGHHPRTARAERPSAKGE